MEFRIGKHAVTGAPMVEVWEGVNDNGKLEGFIGGIYGQGNGLKIVSLYLDGVQHSSDQPPSIVVQFVREGL